MVVENSAAVSSRACAQRMRISHANDEAPRQLCGKMEILDDRLATLPVHASGDAGVLRPNVSGGHTCALL